MRRRNRPRFLCSGGCGRRVWREHTFCSPRCERIHIPTLLDQLGPTMSSPTIAELGRHDPATAEIPF